MDRSFLKNEQDLYLPPNRQDPTGESTLPTNWQDRSYQSQPHAYNREPNPPASMSYNPKIIDSMGRPMAEYPPNPRGHRHTESASVLERSSIPARRRYPDHVHYTYHSPYAQYSGGSSSADEYQRYSPYRYQGPFYRYPHTKYKSPPDNSHPQYDEYAPSEDQPSSLHMDYGGTVPQRMSSKALQDDAPVAGLGISYQENRSPGYPEESWHPYHREQHSYHFTPQEGLPPEAAIGPGYPRQEYMPRYPQIPVANRPVYYFPHYSQERYRNNLPRVPQNWMAPNSSTHGRVLKSPVRHRRTQSHLPGTSRNTGLLNPLSFQSTQTQLGVPMSSGRPVAHRPLGGYYWGVTDEQMMKKTSTRRDSHPFLDTSQSTDANTVPIQLCEPPLKNVVPSNPHALAADPPSRNKKKTKYTADQDRLILDLKHQGLGWSEIAELAKCEKTLAARNRYQVLIGQQGGGTFMWTMKDIRGLQGYLDEGERAKWQFIADELSKRRGRKFTIDMCHYQVSKLFNSKPEMFGVVRSKDPKLGGTPLERRVYSPEFDLSPDSPDVGSSTERSPDTSAISVPAFT